MENTKGVVDLQRVKIIAHKDILSFREAQVYLDISKSLLYKLTSKRLINYTKPNGGKIYFMRLDLDNWMLQNPINSIRVLEKEIFNHLENNKNGEKKN